MLFRIQYNFRGRKYRYISKEMKLRGTITVKRIYRTLLTIVPSTIIAIITFYICTKITSITDQQFNIIQYAPYVMFIIIFAIAWRFNYSRIFFNNIILTVGFVAIYQLHNIHENPEDIYQIICFLLPFNMLIFSFLKERGILSLWGLFRMVFIIMQSYLFYQLVGTNYQAYYKWIEKDLLPTNWFSHINIFQISFLLLIITVVILIIKVILHKSTQDASEISILVLLYYVINTNELRYYPIIFTGIGMILIVSILQATYFIAFYDELTHLPSRRALKQDMMKLGMKYSIAMLDIDFFKKFNDKYGHDTGDDVLRLVASIIKDVGGGGKAYRYGGEEFTIIFSGKHAEDTLIHLEELREQIEQRGFTISNKKSTAKKQTKNHPKKQTKKTVQSSKKVSITISIGVAQKGEKCRTTDSVIKAADAALYRAKKKGRNCVFKAT